MIDVAHAVLWVVLWIDVPALILLALAAWLAVLIDYVRRSLDQ